MFRVFVFSICLLSSIWSAFVIYSLTEPKDDLSPNTVFSTKDNSVLIINRPEQYKWENADFVTLNENKIKAQALLPHLNSSFSKSLDKKAIFPFWSIIILLVTPAVSSAYRLNILELSSMPIG